MQGLNYQVVAFYKYVHIIDAEVFAVKHLRYCYKHEVKCRIYISDEGINGQFSGTKETCSQYIADLTADERFADILFKIDDVAQPAFNKTHVRYKREIVHSQLTVNPIDKTGIHLSGQDFLEMKDRDDVVLLDVRSEYEHRIGRFKDALTLPIDNFRELPEHIDYLSQYKGKKVITYCTGGIKCEKASAYLLSQGFEEVYQLHGGIIQYAKETGGKDFEGDLYVFDGRVVIPVNEVNPTVISYCIHCHSESTRMVNCSNEICNKKVIMCDSCGWDWDGACATDCKSASLREYTGTGYYAKPGTTRFYSVEENIE
ncbi:MAG: rhodanese-related sulfurtransferase [Bacteroidota bacterium]|nr:rhodanese-related sulfurtransferase [Bacteroidota bacterium]